MKLLIVMIPLLFVMSNGHSTIRHPDQSTTKHSVHYHDRSTTGSPGHPTITKSHDGHPSSTTPKIENGTFVPTDQHGNKKGSPQPVQINVLG